MSNTAQTTGTMPLEFSVNKEAKTVSVKKTFAADRALVWDAFTKPEILDQWWAPRPWISRTKVMDFEEGGRRFYAMVSPEGQEHWSVQKFTSITPQSNFRMRSAFADASEQIEASMPSSEWNLDFIAQGNDTLVDITIQHTKLEHLQKLLDMGFQGGFTMTLTFLEGLLAERAKK